jgi:flagellar biosynthesis/type III secretory pathway M-ring protein FliF/YscJ
MSLPFEPHELLSRVRSQLRNRAVIEDLRQHSRSAEENQIAAEQVVTAVREERRTVRTAGMLGLAVLLVAVVVFLIFYRRSQQQNTRVYAAITRLQTGMLTEQKLMNHSGDDGKRDLSPVGDSEKLKLQKQTQDLKSEIAVSKTDNSALQNQLSLVEGRLQRLETEGKVAQTIIQSYEPSVCLIHVVVGFRDRTTG